ncbi:SOS response-associated peptidase [Vallitalea pronyensis]|uniref:Abasic site processing protein n=1 Tax=Vallitalea pronyensis TaxID=1348613 RepID=A0A8J8SGE2_9FIRM|nr:SOS response-associated peptidase [Vallitalea pronyensis]QUI22511.1 SOS response-associated peptidase [Vallitalea pronyensis]
MCGRFVLTLDFKVLMDILKGRFHIEDLPDHHQYEPRYNIAPSQPVLSVIDHRQQARVGYLKWGYIPSWAKDEKIGYKMINARSESIDTKPAYRYGFLQRRCLILSNGFYEWKKNGRHKTPMFIHLKDKKLFTMAGLYSVYYNQAGEKISTCTIITTQPNTLMTSIHDRMPVILDEASEQQWLDSQIKDPVYLKSLLKPFPSHLMKAYGVSSLVNSPKNEHPDCIEPFQETLF